MRILFVAAEIAPLVKVGGLADVIGSLPKALNRLGHDVRVMIPKYGTIDLVGCKATPVVDEFELSVAGMVERVSLEMLTLENALKVYLVDNEDFRKVREPYGEGELERFLLFCVAVVDILPRMGWQPEIVHCHDWHTGLIPLGLKAAGGRYVSFFTIHNLAYQGNFDASFLANYGLEKWWRLSSPAVSEPPLNFLGAGILWADVVTTVSETYAREILTAEYGEGLDYLLRRRQDRLFGIVNGLDYKEYNPLTDPFLVANYDVGSLDKRLINKLALQEKVGLPKDAEVPLIGMVSRLDDQKGLDIVTESFASLFQRAGVQMVVLGKGKERYHTLLRQAAMAYPQCLAVVIAFDEPLARLIYGGCDMFLMPSRFEPCGLGQLIAMRYGALPIVRHTGGLAETVENLADDLSVGTGFAFYEYSAKALLEAIETAVNAYKNKQAWRKAMSRAMSRDFSWQASAQKYESLYRRALEGHL